MASKSDKARKNEDTYGEASDVVDRIVYKAFQSFRDERIPRKELTKRLGLSAEIIRNMERGHRKMTVSGPRIFAVTKPNQQILSVSSHRR